MSKQSEDDLLADEIEDEGEEDQINKDLLPDERNAVPAHASRQLKDKTAASSEEISQLTHAILGLTKSLPELINSPKIGKLLMFLVNLSQQFSPGPKKMGLTVLF